MRGSGIGLLVTAAFSLLASGSPLSERKIALRACVANALGANSAHRIVVPTDGDYTDARLGEKIQDEQLPQMLAYATDIEQVGPLVKCAVTAGVQPVPRNGGHHFEAFSALNNSLVIDLGHVNYVKVSQGQQTATVGAGIRLGALYKALDAYNTTFPGGICPTVGLTGLLSAGGFNLQMRTLGISADWIRSAKVVNAQGNMVIASPSQNADLFWALRGGGGGSYGIIVELEVQTIQFPRSSMVALTWNDTAQRYPVAKRFLKWGPAADPAFMSQVNVYKSKVQVIGWYYGKTAQQATELMKTSGLLEIGAPLVQISGNCDTDNGRLFGYTTFECMPDNKVNSSMLNVIPEAFAPATNNTPTFRFDEQVKDPSTPQAPAWPRFRRISKSFFVQKSAPIKDDTLKQVVDMIGHLDDASQVWGEWHAWNVSSGPVSNNAFAWRQQALAHLEFQVHGSEDPATQNGYLQWFKNLENLLRPALGPASYPGYADTTISVNPLTAYYGSNVCKLIDVKKRYDPKDVFTNPLAIPLSPPKGMQC